MININLHAIKTPSLWISGFIIISLAGCASYDFAQYIPGADRILHPQSKAEVGPVLTETPTAVNEKPEPASITSPTKTAIAVEEQIIKTDIKKPSSTIDKTPHPTQPTKIAAPLKGNENSNKIVSPISTLPPKLEKTIKVTPPENKTYSVIGSVQLAAAGKLLNPKGTIITVKRFDGKALYTANSNNETLTVDMEDKTYLPAQLIIRKGDSISFVNKDEIRHNVFSSTGANAFDLGTYGAGLQRAVKLNEQGIVKVYCNIHPNMATFVAVDDIGISKLIGEDGHFEINNLPTGKYQLSAWNLRGEQNQLFTVTDNSAIVNVTIDTSSYVENEHTNKFGKDYSKDTLNNEFY